MPKCSDCDGTGADRKKTKIMRKRECDNIAYVRCWTCMGNGIIWYPDYSKHGEMKKCQVKV
jgi:hypothetical protein